MHIKMKKSNNIEKLWKMSIFIQTQAKMQTGILFRRQTVNKIDQNSVSAYLLKEF